MPRSKPTPVRFSAGQETILKKIAAACDVKEVDVTRWAVEAIGQYFDYHHGRLLLPLNFSESFRVIPAGRPDHLVLHEPPRRSTKVRHRGGAKQKV